MEKTRLEPVRITGPAAPQVLASRSRSEEAGVSKVTRQRRATQRCDATTCGPKGWGGEGPSAALRLLDVSKGYAFVAAPCIRPLGAPNAPDGPIGIGS